MKTTAIVAVIGLSALALPAAAGERDGLYVETGLVVGGVVGAVSPSHSDLRAVSDVGYLWGRRPDPDGSKWGGGVTLYLGLGTEDLRLGLKPRIRYSILHRWSFDVSAGYIFATLENEPNVSDTGFVGGLHLHYGNWVTLRTDVNVKKVDEWTTVHWNQPVVHAGGYETAVYVGLALRNRPGWVATSVGTAALLGLMLVVLASGGGT
jgi:hypothetical protein